MTLHKPARKVMEGSRAVAEAVKAARPAVISAYPISPQTHIVEDLSKMAVAGEYKGEYICVDSEFSAASVVYGASAAGVRAYTASSSQGLLLMVEVIYSMAGTRLPVVLTGVNRTVSSPISIQPDHQDTMALRDAGLLQIHVEDMQEAYDAHLQAFKIAENPQVLLPVMVCMDGWILTHAYEPVELLSQDEVDCFLPPYTPVHCLDPKDPLIFGSYVDDDKLMEFRYMIQDAMGKASEIVKQVAEDFNEEFDRYYGGLTESYRLEDADLVILAMGSVVGTIKDAVDSLRREGLQVGLLKIRTYRPFPGKELQLLLKGKKGVVVLDKSISFGSGPILAAEVKEALFHLQGCERPEVYSVVAGLGGRDITPAGIAKMIKVCLENPGEASPGPYYLDLNRSLLTGGENS